MNTGKIIGKLTPAHFKNGENFDAETFASLIKALQKSRTDIWIMLAIWAAGLLVSRVFSAMGGLDGNLMALACIFGGLIGGNMAVIGTTRRAKAAREKLGITQRDIKAAIRQVKDEVKNTPQEHVEKQSCGGKIKFDKIITPFTQSESGFYDEKLESAKKESLKKILAAGNTGEKFLLDFLMRDVTVSGEYFNLNYYGDYANSEWYKKQEIVLALSCTTDKTIINKLSEILMLKGKENQFWTVFQPAVAETLGNLKEYSSLERYINSGQNVPAVLLSKDILRLYKTGVLEKMENIRDEKGHTPLHNAVIKEDAVLVQKLLADGVDIDIICSRGEELGKTALYIAVAGANLEIVKLLIEHKANLSAAAWNGTFPLQRAAAMGQFDIVKLLIANGANKQQKTLTGKTALMWAEQNGHANIAALLK
jgi:hypothetical protein